MIIIIVKLINQRTRATTPMTRTPKISLFNNERKVALHALFIFVHLQSLILVFPPFSKPLHSNLIPGF